MSKRQRQQNETMTSGDVARELGVALSTVRGWRVRGHGPAYRTERIGLGYRVTYLRSEIERFRRELENSC